MNEAIAQQAQRLIATYPRQRPALSQAVAERYERQYLMNRSRHSWGGKLSGIAEAWMHRAVAADLSAQGPAPRVLEVGAGNLNHWRYEPSVKHYEVVEPFEALLATSPEREKLAPHYRDLADLPLNASFDRIVSIAAFEHLMNLPWCIARCALALHDGGSLRVAVPSEGGFLWWLGWRLTTGLEFALRYRLDYGEIMRHEHLSKLREIDTLLRYFFEQIHRRRLGFGTHASLYAFYHCEKPHLARCKALLDRTGC